MPILSSMKVDTKEYFHAHCSWKIEKELFLHKQIYIYIYIYFNQWLKWNKHIVNKQTGVESTAINQVHTNNFLMFMLVFKL